MTERTVQNMPYDRSLSQEFDIPKILFALTLQEAHELTVANSVAQSYCSKKLS